MRKTFVKTLIAEAAKNKRIMLLTGDLGFTVFEEYIGRFPERFLNVGVAEQNMISLAAGMALAGRTVVCYSIASFASARPYEQIKLDVASHRLPVIITGVGSGLSYSTASITHHSLDDIGLMRLIPGMTVLSPADNFETAWATKRSLNLNGPVYLRLGKDEQPDIYKSVPRLNLGHGSVVSRGRKVAIFTTGAITAVAMDAANILRSNKINPTVISIHTIKPLDERLVRETAKSHSLIVTVEEHGTAGGLGSAVSQIIASGDYPSKSLIIGTGDRFIYGIGSLKYMRSLVGLTPGMISRNIIRALYNTKQ
jgi:transketolase